MRYHLFAVPILQTSLPARLGSSALPSTGRRAEPTLIAGSRAELWRLMVKLTDTALGRPPIDGADTVAQLAGGDPRGPFGGSAPTWVRN